MKTLLKVAIVTLIIVVIVSVFVDRQNNPSGPADATATVAESNQY